MSELTQEEVNLERDVAVQGGVRPATRAFLSANATVLVMRKEANEWLQERNSQYAILCGPNV